MHLLLIDATGITRCIWEAAHDLSGQERAQRLLGSGLASFKRCLSQHQPTHVLAAFDAEGPCWRHEVFEGYKQGREPAGPLFHETSRVVMARLRRDLGVHCISTPNVEADDVIATATMRCATSRPDAAVTIVSGDKDLCALINEKVRVFHHFNRQWRDGQWVQETMGIAPHQICDFLALAGDRSDGIPGVRGIGQDRAARLLANYGSLHTILQLPGGKRANPTVRRVQAHREDALLSLRLAQPRTDIHLGVSWSMLARSVQDSALPSQ